jgi:hypothetical protein
VRKRVTAMALIRKRNDRIPDPDRFLVYSGKAVVGTSMRVPSGEKQGWWHWSITGFHVSPTDLGPGAGMSPSQEEGLADFARRWRTWLDWAGLREREEEERVRLP